MQVLIQIVCFLMFLYREGWCNQILHFWRWWCLKSRLKCLSTEVWSGLMDGIDLSRIRIGWVPQGFYSRLKDVVNVPLELDCLCVYKLTDEDRHKNVSYCWRECCTHCRASGLLKHVCCEQEEIVMLACNSFMTIFGSNNIRWCFSCISLCMMSRHLDGGIGG